MIDEGKSSYRDNPCSSFGQVDGGTRIILELEGRKNQMGRCWDCISLALTLVSLP